jgi:hypothetical protein
MKKRIIIHAGTHKTGTTFLQSFLSLNYKRLLDKGILFPLSGKIGKFSGHHNIAWQLNDDERFKKKYGTLEELCSEIKQSKCRTIILSSEDFGFIHLSMDKLHFVKQKFNELGYRVEAILCFREPVSYADSLYCELLKYGLDVSFNDFIDEIIENGRFNFTKKQIYSFKYDEIEGGFKEELGADNVHRISYMNPIEPLFFDAAGLQDMLFLKNLQTLPAIRSMSNKPISAIKTLALAKFNKSAVLKGISESQKKIGRNHIIGYKLGFTASDEMFSSEYTFFDEALKKDFIEILKNYNLYFDFTYKTKLPVSKIIDNPASDITVSSLADKALVIGSLNPILSKIFRKFYKMIYK